MEGQNSGRTLLAAALLTATLLVAANRAVEAAPFADWWLPILLFVLAIGLLLLNRFGWRLGAAAPAFDVEPETTDLAPLPVGGTRTYRVSDFPAADNSAVVAAPAAPVNTMFIRPERAADADEAPSAAHPVPSTQAAAPAAVEVDLTPENAVIDSHAGEDKPSQGMPLEKATEPGAPAPTPGFTARTEHSPAEAAATQEKPAPPPEAQGETAQPHDDPVKESVVEKTAAPQQAYETATMGTLTPEEVDKVVNDQPSETAAKATTPASEELTIAVTDPEAAVGSADDLEIIDGIGPKIAGALRAAGIDSFKKLANATEDQLRQILTGAQVRYPGTTLPFWAQQAAYAARQDWEGFKKYNADRKAGGDD